MTAVGLTSIESLRRGNTGKDLPTTAAYTQECARILRSRSGQTSGIKNSDC
jgi:hypothetical protein